MSNQPSTPHHRRSIRLPGYDYSEEGSYYITIVTHNRESLFGKILDGEMQLNPFGKIVHDEWVNTKKLRPNVEIIDDEFVVMPNHFHGIIHLLYSMNRKLQNSTGANPTGANPTGAYINTPLQCFRSPSQTLGAIVRGYKSVVTKRINELRNTPGIQIWQRNYYEHIISTDREYDQIADHIFSNPLNWNNDSEQPESY